MYVGMGLIGFAMILAVNVVFVVCPECLGIDEFTSGMATQTGVVCNYCEGKGEVILIKDVIHKFR